MFVNTRQQGDIGELSAAAWLASRGAKVCWPVGHSPDWDLLIEWHEWLYRVQVKTTTCRRNGRWVAMVCTRGGNQSWSGLVKRFDPARCDFLFVHVGDGRRWMMPADAVEARSAISLGGPKYGEWEIEAGVPIPHGAAVDAAA
jgi:hypothetical protein